MTPSIVANNYHAVFGRRKSRSLSTQQTFLLHNLLPKLELIPQLSPNFKCQDVFPIDISSWHLDIGSGNGDNAMNILDNIPNSAVIANEVYVNGIVRLLKRLATRPDLHHRLRIYPYSFFSLLPFLTSSKFQHIHILFPDPWPKKKHHKRRLVNNTSLHQLSSLLLPNGFLHIASDHQDYIEWTMQHAHIKQLQWLDTQPTQWLNPYFPWTSTPYLRKALNRQQTCFFLNFKKSCET